MKKLTLTLLAGLMATSAHAASGGGSDMCGLGWEITNKKSFLATTTRSTTNAFVPPTFGMTTGTIGCDKHSLARRDIPAAQFVASNYDAVMMDMAQGQGENLEALAHTMGCGDVKAFGEMTRRDFSSLTNDADSLELVRRLRTQAAQLGCSA